VDNFKPITVAGGLGFVISESNFRYAKKAANDTRLTHFVGVLEGGGEIVSCHHDSLLGIGCQQIAWITPDPSPMTAASIVNQALIAAGLEPYDPSIWPVGSAHRGGVQ
jgi:hypothetical protein